MKKAICVEVDQIDRAMIERAEANFQEFLQKGKMDTTSWMLFFTLDFNKF